MRVVVTGATGNVGTALVPHLLDEGHRVVGVARRPPLGPMRRDGSAEADWVALDLTGADRDSRLAEAFAGADVVVHTAWGFQPTRDAAYLRRLDVGGSAAVLQASRDAGVAHLVHVSSVGAYSSRVGDAAVDETWPTRGIGRLPYSLDKARVETLLDRHEQQGVPPLVTRVRPSLMGRRDVGSALARYTLPSLLPAAVVRHVPLLPLPPWFRVQLTHTDDVARGIATVVERRAVGAYNLGATPALGRDDLAAALGARAVDTPWPLVRGAAAAAWAVRLQPVDPGWLDMAAAVPLLSSARAEADLDWRPRHSPASVLEETIAGIADGASADTPALRPRLLAEQLGRLLRHGPVSRRRIA